MRRRIFLQSGAAAAALALAPQLARAAKPVLDWAALRRRVGARLIDINSPLVECARKHGAGADALFAALKNPYYLSDEPSLTQSLGWIGAWTSRPSIKGVAAASASEEQPAYPGIPGHEPNIAEGRRGAAGVSAAMREIYKVAPNAGAYVSESDYFQRDWKRAYWGEHYPRLARAKRKYDPHWIFRGRNCVEPA